MLPSPEVAFSQAFSWFQPACGWEMLSLLASVSKQDECSGHCAGCLTGGYDQRGAVGRSPGEVFTSCLPPWHLPGWNAKAVHIFHWGRGLRSNFCVCLLRSFIVPQTICELLFGNICFRTVIEFTSGKYFTWTQTWESLVFPFDLGCMSYCTEMASPTFV